MCAKCLSTHFQHFFLVGHLLLVVDLSRQKLMPSLSEIQILLIGQRREEIKNFHVFFFFFTTALGVDEKQQRQYKE